MQILSIYGHRLILRSCRLPCISYFEAREFQVFRTQWDDTFYIMIVPRFRQFINNTLRSMIFSFLLIMNIRYIVNIRSILFKWSNRRQNNVGISKSRTTGVGLERTGRPTCIMPTDSVFLYQWIWIKGVPELG